MDIKFGQNIELIGIGDDLIFKVTAVEKLKVHGCGKVCGGHLFSENTVTSFTFLGSCMIYDFQRKSKDGHFTVQTTGLEQISW